MDEENLSFEELLNNSFEENKKLDKITTGTVIEVNSEGEIFVDLNYKADGIVPKGEYSYDENADPKKELNPGDKIEVEVIKLNDGQGNVLLSCKKLQQKSLREAFENKVKNNEIFDEKVQSVNDKGLVVNVAGIRVFIPSSLSCGNKERARFKIIEYNPKERKVIGSCKIILDEEKKKKEEEFWSNVEVGKEYEGTVSSLSSYGAFVDINGVQGLLHISEITWDKDAKVQDILKQGQTIKVKIKELDKENKRMKLSYTEKGEDPWNSLELNVGDIIKVKVKKFMPFGVFVEVKKGIDGLVHISQISEQKISKPEEKLQIGEEVNCKVINVDLENKKLELSIRELEGTSSEYSSLEK